MRKLGQKGGLACRDRHGSAFYRRIAKEWHAKERAKLPPEERARKEAIAQASQLDDDNFEIIFDEDE